MPQMVAAEEVFLQYSTKANPVQKLLGNSVKLFPIQAGAIAVSTVLGFIYTPTYRTWVKAIAGWLASNIGFFAGKYLANAQQKAALPAVAALLGEDFAPVPSERLEEIAEKFEMTVDEMQLLLSELYFEFFKECTKSESIDTAELRQLEQLKTYLNLTTTEVGTQVFKVGQQLDKDDQSKFVFLAERLLRNDTVQGYEYEASRNQEELGLSKDEWLGLAEEGSLPLYEKALNRAVIEGKPCTAAQLKTVQELLGISDANAEGKHQEVLDKLTSTGASPDAVAAAKALMGSP